MLQLATIFAAVFVAELGDKTQLATLLFAIDGKSHPFLVFLAAAGALCLSSGLAVAVGTYGARYLDLVPLKLVAGVGFIAIGLWTLIEYVRDG
ncbi:MAG: TMEM165/GDT1 family protein [Rhodospirillales bacterium]